MQGFHQGAVIAITDDGTGIATELAALLNQRGCSATVVQQAPADCDTLIFLGGLAEMPDADAAMAVNRAAFLAALAVAPRFSEGDGTFITVQDTGGDFGLSGGCGDRAWSGGLPGLAKTAAMEWQGEVKAIDLERREGSPATLAARLLDEMLAGGPEIEVGLTANGERLRLESYESVSGVARPTIGRDSVILASGGARGVTAVTLIELAKQCQPRMVLLGRTALTEEPAMFRGATTDGELKKALVAEAKANGQPIKPAELGRRASQILAVREIRANLKALAEAGSEVMYMVADVQSPRSLNEGLETVRQEWGGITGIVHGAGVLNDKLIADKTPDMFDRTFNTKVRGLQALLEATRDDPVRMICLFSSVAGRYGNPGQCDYAMANEVLNKTANTLAISRGPDCNVKSINWGPWDGGMVSPLLKKHFEQMGIPLIPYDTGAKQMVAEIAEATPANTEIVIGPRPPQPSLLSDGMKTEVHRTVTIDTGVAPWLSSHCIQDHPVLPAVMAMEWFLRSARLSDQKAAGLQVTDLQVMRGVQMPERYFSGHVSSRQEDSGYGMELRGADGHLYYKARVAPAGLPKGGIDSGLPADPTAWDRDAASAYRNDLFHGPDLQVITSLDGVSPDSAVATLQGHDAMGRRQGLWVSDAAILDGGLQLAILWGLQNTGKSSVPMKIASCTVRPGVTSSGPVRCELRGRITGDKLITDQRFFDEAGQLLAVMEGAELIFVPGT